MTDPNVIEVLQDRMDIDWELGDTLLETIGPRRPGQGEQFHEYSRALGMRFQQLMMARDAAELFPADEDRQGVSILVANNARSPIVVQYARQVAENLKRPLDSKMVLHLRRTLAGIKLNSPSSTRNRSIEDRAVEMATPEQWDQAVRHLSNGGEPKPYTQKPAEQKIEAMVYAEAKKATLTADRASRLFAQVEEGADLSGAIERIEKLITVWEDILESVQKESA